MPRPLNLLALGTLVYARLSLAAIDFSKCPGTVLWEPLVTHLEVIQKSPCVAESPHWEETSESSARSLRCGTIRMEMECRKTIRGRIFMGFIGIGEESVPKSRPLTQLLGKELEKTVIATIVKFLGDSCIKQPLDESDKFIALKCQTKQPGYPPRLRLTYRRPDAMTTESFFPIMLKEE